MNRPEFIKGFLVGILVFSGVYLVCFVGSDILNEIWRIE